MAPVMALCPKVKKLPQNILREAPQHSYDRIASWNWQTWNMRDLPQFPSGLLLIEPRKKPWLVGLYTVGRLYGPDIWRLKINQYKSLYKEPVQWKVRGLFSWLHWIIAEAMGFFHFGALGTSRSQWFDSEPWIVVAILLFGGKSWKNYIKT